MEHEKEIKKNWTERGATKRQWTVKEIRGAVVVLESKGCEDFICSLTNLNIWFY